MKAVEYNKNLPDFLHRTDEQLAREAARQKDVKAVFNYDEDEVLYKRAQVDEKAAKEELQTATDDDVIAFNRLKLAEAYLEQGEFYNAWLTHPDTRYREFLKRIQEAGSAKTCEHAQFRNYVEVRGNERVPVQIPNFRLWRIVYNGDPHKFISIFVCNVCLSIWKEAS